MFKKYGFYILITFITIFGLFFRLWNLNFGLPHSYYADEPEITGFALTYAAELKDAVFNDAWYKLVPVSYVYGMFPTYFVTPFVIIFSKILHLLVIPFDTATIYLFVRYINSILSFLIVPTIAYLYFRLFNDKVGALVTFFLLAFNWKLIVHAHYANADIFLTLLLALSFLTLFLYSEKKKDTLYTFLSGAFFGLAVGTKITALITYPLYCWVYIKKKDYRGLVAFSFLMFGAFVLSNPFSIIFSTDFVFRIYSMLFKEAGLVFDSVDLNPLKYILGLFSMVTLPVFIASVLGFYNSFKGKTKNITTIPFHKFLVSTLVFYVLFYSIQSRRVDRWLLPILPIVIMYASYYVSTLISFIKKNSNSKILFKILLTFLLLVSGIYYLYFPVNLLFQFQRNTPRSEAYLWLRDMTPVRPLTHRILVYTEEGLDPMVKLSNIDVVKVKVYENDAAFLFFPLNASSYKYVVVSSRIMENHKKGPVIEKYPTFANKWNAFENLLNSPDFKLIKSFEMSQPNLIPLSNIYVYENQKLP